MDYTIIGGGVNLAARLETAGTPGEILVSYETYAHVKDVIHCQPQDKLTVKGISKPIATYRVVDFHENMDETKRPIREKFPHFQLELDVSLMTVAQQKEALAILKNSVDRLSKPNKRPAAIAQKKKHEV